MISRPFNVIGHNPNRLEDCRRFLEAGANGLEPDVQWDPDRNDLVIAHDPEHVADAPLVRDFFRGLVDLSIEFPALALIVLDNKTQESRRGAQLLGYARDAFLAPGCAADAPRLSVLMTVPSLGGNALFRDVAAPSARTGRTQQCAVLGGPRPAAMLAWVGDDADNPVEHGGFAVVADPPGRIPVEDPSQRPRHDDFRRPCRRRCG